MEIAIYLASGPPIPVVPDGAQTQEQARDVFRRRSASVCHLLSAIVLDILFKVIWEFDNGKECRYTHKVKEFYDGLVFETCLRIKQMFDRHLSNTARMKGTGADGCDVILGDLVPFATWEETLEANVETMRNFKYDNRYKGKTIVLDNVIWKDGTFWVLPRMNLFLSPCLSIYGKGPRVELDAT